MVSSDYIQILDRKFRKRLNKKFIGKPKHSDKNVDAREIIPKLVLENENRSGMRWKAELTSIVESVQHEVELPKEIRIEFLARC